MAMILKLYFIGMMLTVQLQYASSSLAESKLIKNLTTNYDTNIRPSENSTEPTDVRFDLRLTKIVKLDIKEQQLVINARILMRWTDKNLKWNKVDFDNINHFVAQSSLFWTPDILLYNTANDESVSGSDVYKANLQVNENGTVTWMAPVTLRSSCDIAVKWFPFDTQSCSLIFGSVSMTNKKLRLLFYNKPGSVDSFKDKFHYSSGVWSLKTLSSQIRDETYACCTDPFSLIEFTVNLNRLPMYYVLYLVLPCLCLSIMSPCIFFIPPESGERIGFGITVVLAMSVYLLVISDKLPEKSDQSPLIGVLYTELFFIMIGTLLAVVLTTHLAYKTTKPPRKIRHLFCNRCTRNSRSRKEVGVHGNDDIPAAGSAIGMENIEERDVTPSDLTLHRRKTVSRTMSGIRREFTLMTPEEEKEMKNQEQWKEIAERIDKVNFWIFLTLTIAVPFFSVLFYLV